MDTPSTRARSQLRQALYVLLASGLPLVTAQSCISLSGSRACPAFNASSISTDSTLVGFFPFLSSVTSTANFDTGLENYISNGWAQSHFQNVFGCTNVTLSNTTNLYARYTASYLCNAIVQNSISACSLSGNAAKPLCADSCAAFALSEQSIVASNICGKSNNNALNQIRADFTQCALPANSLTGSCLSAAYNEPNNCGFNQNLGSLCSYCAASSPNATDSCCVFANTTSRCSGVTLPIMAAESLAPVTVIATSATPSATSSSTAAGSSVNHGLSGGQIAGIVVGAVVGALLLLALIIIGCIMFRRRHASSPATSIFEQPATMQEVPSSAYTDGTRDHERAGLAVPFGARVARMSALEGSSSSNGGGMMAGYRKSTSSESETPHSRGTSGLAPPTTAKRSGSLSSGSRLGMGIDTSPSSGNDYTSPESHGQSEQLPFFKDYYSQDEIHAGDMVSTLWAYEPRAADEFSLERGDMIKVVGIWDDGWATGMRIRSRAEDWRPDEKVQRDSGMSNGSSRPPNTSDGEGEVKAFPLVCVCLPQHWRKTIEGESTEDNGDY
ncbi:hypothetical protein AMS68_004709 [Peltaster fructicola]|uniref:SH3 domain-containing protein n=1 Tax=Peltaster fructicola TaxID=286661 RepID=A0A6H0XWP0_9PEZI|nr:hypothetical protein AMS68_004709 [Peltaster fructicola]